MSYTPTTWANGDVVTATKLNKIEQGIANGGGVFLVTFTLQSNQYQYLADKTYGEIKTAIDNGNSIMFKVDDGHSIFYLSSYEFVYDQNLWNHVNVYTLTINPTNYYAITLFCSGSDNSTDYPLYEETGE